VSGSTIVPGSSWEGGKVTITDANGLEGDYTVRYVASANQLFLDRDFEGTTVEPDTGNPAPATVADPLTTANELVESVGTVTSPSR
jgi:hypothetical protein